MLYDLANCDSHSDLSCFEDDNLIETLRNLASDSAKYRSKKDRKQQKSSFRDILKLLEDGQFDNQTIKFGTEHLYLDNWLRKKQYESFRELLGTGMNAHLQENDFIREMFDLGAPLVNNQVSRKQALFGMSHMQKTLLNREQFKSRTKSMNKRRDNKDNMQAGTAMAEDD